MLYKKIAFNFPRDISFFVIFQETFVHLLPNMVWCTLWLQKLHHTSRPVVPKTTAGMALIFKVVGHWFVMMECQKPLYVMVLLFLFKDGCGIGMRSQNQKMCWHFLRPSMCEFDIFIFGT